MTHSFNFNVNPHVLAKAQLSYQRYLEIQKELCQCDISSQNAAYAALAREASSIATISQLYAQLQQLTADLHDYQTLFDRLDDNAQKEIRALNTRQQDTYNAITSHLSSQTAPQDDIHAIFVEIRAGVGGSEAGLFVAVLCQMYLGYAQKKGFQAKVVTNSEGEHGGFREIILKIEGVSVYSRFQFEAGVHRVQRVPLTEAQGRIHTSTCTVAVLPVADVTSELDVVINPAEIRIDTFKASGAGGQHVNKTDSAVRIYHLPTKIIVQCQSDRSQHRNREEAMQMLKGKLQELHKKEHSESLSAQRKTQMGTGDRSERIRTYNYPQKRVTDHRVNVTLHKLEQVLMGDLDDIITALLTTYDQKLS
jgi:peptide chain release factor 1